MPLTSLLSRVPQNITGVISGAVGGQIRDRLNALSMKIPTEYLGIASALLQDSTVDPLQTLMFRVRIAGFELPESAIQAISLPHFTVEYRTQVQAGLPVHYPKGIRIASDLNIRFNETRKAEILQLYNALMQKIYKPTSLDIGTLGDAGSAAGAQGGTYGLPDTDGYKLDVIVDILGRGDSTPTWSINYSGCSPVSLGNYDMDAAGGNFVQPQMVLRPEQILMFGPSTTAGNTGGPLATILGNATRTARGTIRNYIGF